MPLDPPVVDGLVVEDVGFLFRYLGGVQFHTVSQPLDAPGSARVVATSNNFGLTFYSDLSGEAHCCLLFVVARWYEMATNTDGLGGTVCWHRSPLCQWFAS